MGFNVECNKTEYLPGIAAMLGLFVPAWQAQPPAYDLRVKVREDGPLVTVEAACFDRKGQRIAGHVEKGDLTRRFALMKSEPERLVKLCVWRLLAKQWPAQASPWGILRGVRPTKLVQRLFDQGVSAARVAELLVADYALSRAKAELIATIGERQRPFLPDEGARRRWLSIYIGIPFCPTRCLYCSFPAAAIDRVQHLIAPFLEALSTEIALTGAFIRQHRLLVETIYIGGGTPSCLTPTQLADLFTQIRAQLLMSVTREITVEAGRPDSLTVEKLNLIREFGATRLCLNPQTLNDGTLKRIGRRHTAADFFRIFELARRLGFHNINSDLIIGLPGETVADFARTLDLLLPLGPENVTVHTLAVKRASQLKEKLAEVQLAEQQTVAAMQALAAARLGDAGLVPYYLYRQKQSLAQLENLGYAQQDKYCIYNIQMMEERQTILGLGGGASTKIIDPISLRVTTLHNPKDPQVYLQQAPQLAREKLATCAAVLTLGG